MAQTPCVLGDDIVDRQVATLTVSTGPRAGDEPFGLSEYQDGATRKGGPMDGLLKI